MKRTLWAALVLAMAFTACKKDETSSAPDLETNINGAWSVTNLNYNANVPYVYNGQTIQVPITGDAANCGSITFNKANKGCTYNIKFKPSISGLSVTLDTITLLGAGFYTINSATSLTIKDTLTNQTLPFTVELNETANQRWNTVTPYQIDSVTTTNVSLKFNMVRK